jgi:nucleoside-diphosphate-sugar epimerase
MKILLIGGSGFIGHFVVRDLIAAGHDVAVYHRGRSTTPLPKGAHEIIGDRSQLGWKRMDFIRVRPDVVIDCILSSGIQAKGVMDVFRGVTPRLVVLSSQDVYRAYGVLLGLETALQPVPITEDSDLRRNLRPFDRDHLKRMQRIFNWVDDEYEKIEVERAVTGDPELPATVLRLPMVYGPGDPLHRLYQTVKRIDDDRPAILLEDGLARCVLPRGYVENVAAAIALAATSDRAKGGDRIYNITEPPHPELEWTRMIGEAAGWNGEVIALSTDLTPAHLRQPYNTAQNWTVSSDRIRSELGFTEPVAIPEALRRTIEWERRNPPSDLPPGTFDYAAEDAAIQRFKPTRAERHP